MAAEGDDDGEASLSDYIDKLSMSAKMDFCDGIVHNFNFTQCDIDARLFGKLNDIASEYSSNKVLGCAERTMKASKDCSSKL